ncbi:MAG: uracil-DNA glycosylase [Parvularculaceae bacterium]|nr:uracil-DNA glycosylase [Parvularculaceae bacterium]
MTGTPVMALVRWYAEMGVDEAVAAEACNWYALSKPQSETATPPEERVRASVAARAAASPGAPPPMPADEAVAAAQQAAALCRTHDELEAAVRAFEGCSLKAGARNTVFADGVAGAELLVIGEAPGRDEDAAGKPFVGRAGQLLDRMLAAIGRSRKADTLISNVVYWRPPGNRAPTQVEIAVCRPFVDRLIEITAPKAVLIAGGVPLQALLALPGIMRSRGVWRTVETKGGAKVDALPIFHPAFLLRSPAHKRLAWADLLALERRLMGS